MNDFLNKIPESVIWIVGILGIIVSIGILCHVVLGQAYVFHPEFISFEFK